MSEIISAGIDVGSGAVKVVVMASDPAAGQARLLSHVFTRIRRRDIRAVADEAIAEAIAASDVEQIAYVATTGDGEDLPQSTGHFYGMTTHARGALFLEPRAVAVLDVGALHARAVAMDGRGKVLDYKMTSQCASGSGQFVENIARYLGVSLAEVGALSKQGKNPEKVSGVCAVLAETDVINMVSRGILTTDILRGIHDSMAGRFARLIRSLGVGGVVFVSGGLSQDEGLIAALADALAGPAQPRRGVLRQVSDAPIELVTHPLGVHAGAIGAALWGAFRTQKLQQTTTMEPAWIRTSSASTTAALSSAP